MAEAFLHGFLLSLGLILPIGMQNGFLLTQGALQPVWVRTLPAVVTAGLCDTLLIGAAVIGMSAAALELAWLRIALGVVGCLFLLYMAWSTWRQSPHEQTNAASSAWSIRKQVWFTASVSLLNPHALIDTLAVIGGSALAYTTDASRLAFAAACVLVSWLWFFGLSVAGHMLGRAAVKAASIQRINRISAAMMLLSCVYLIYMITSYSPLHPHG